MFNIFDKDKSGFLNDEEFYEAFKTLNYGLSDNDIKTLMALADENSDGMISWEEFIPVGIDTIKSFFARNKALQRAKIFGEDLDKEAIQLVFMDEINKTYEILEKKFNQIDEKKEGFIPTSELKKIMTNSNMLNPKEINIILRTIKEKQFEYKLFPQVLYDIRFDLAKSRLMDTNIDKLQEHLIESFARTDLKQ